MQGSFQKAKLGELLMQLGLIDEYVLAQVMPMAKQTGLPLGRALVFSGKLTETQLRLAVEIQSLVRNREVTVDVARKAMRSALSEGITIYEALRKVGWKPSVEAPSAPPVHSLGNMLFESHLVTTAELDEARRMGRETGMPLGRMLVLIGALSDKLLHKALELQAEVKNGSMPYSDAVRALEMSGVDFKAAQSTSAAASAPASTIRLGELLLLAGILTENDIINALELGLSKHQSVGDSLVALGVISRELLGRALELQRQVCAGAIKLAEAVNVLSAAFGGDNTNGGGSEAKQDPIQLGELLKMAGIVDNDDIQQAVELSPKFPTLIGKMLVLSGSIDDATLLASLRCQFLLRHHLISLQDAVVGLQYAQRNLISFDDALEELGIISARK